MAYAVQSKPLLDRITTNRLHGAAALAVIVLISALHYATPLELPRWHNILQHLYYLPIVYAALSFGWKGGLAAAGAAALTLAPHIVLNWTRAPHYTADLAFELPLFCAGGLLTGILVERERRQRLSLIRTSERLAEVYGQLQQNFERLKRAERLSAIGQLSAGLAHEIRNPLASIAGATRILRRNPGDGGKRTECLEIIQRECERLNRLLTQFLDFARPREPRLRPVDPGPLIDSVIDLAGHAAGASPPALEKSIQGKLPRVECDPEQIKQVLLNLLINAIQASPAGSAVKLEASSGDGRLVISVADQGAGIQDGDRERIFDPFFTTKEHGTGLGLSVAQQIVEQHHGILTAAANAGPGTTFTLQLPLEAGRPL